MLTTGLYLLNYRKIKTWNKNQVVLDCYSYDVNKDQFIDADDLIQLMDKIRTPQPSESIADMIREVDLDQDGRINFKEVSNIFI